MIARPRAFDAAAERELRYHWAVADLSFGWREAFNAGFRYAFDGEFPWRDYPLDEDGFPADFCELPATWRHAFFAGYDRGFHARFSQIGAAP